MHSDFVHYDSKNWTWPITIICCPTWIPECFGNFRTKIATFKHVEVRRKKGLILTFQSNLSLADNLTIDYRFVLCIYQSKKKLPYFPIFLSKYFKNLLEKKKFFFFQIFLQRLPLSDYQYNNCVIPEGNKFNCRKTVPIE